MASLLPQLPPKYLSQNTSGQVITANTVILTIATVLLMLRFHARTLSSANRGWDDLLLLPAWILLVGTCVTGYLAVSIGGAGRHTEAILQTTPNTLIVRGKLLYVLTWLSGYSNTFSRISVVTLFLRIFTLRHIQVASWAILIYLVLFVIAQSIVTLLQCRPIAYFWDISIPGGSCFDVFTWYKVNGFLNIAGDLAILLLPIRTVWTLHTSLARRAGIAAVFALGSFGLIASCIRTALFFSLSQGESQDPTWTDAYLMSWMSVESGMYLSAACLVGIRPLLKKAPAWMSNWTLLQGSMWRSRRSGRSNRHGSTFRIATRDERYQTGRHPVDYQAMGNYKNLDEGVQRSQSDSTSAHDQ